MQDSQGEEPQEFNEDDRKIQPFASPASGPVFNTLSLATLSTPLPLFLGWIPHKIFDDGGHLLRPHYFHSITSTPPYDDYSFEELRLACIEYMGQRLGVNGLTDPACALLSRAFAAECQLSGYVGTNPCKESGYIANPFDTLRDMVDELLCLRGGGSVGKTSDTDHESDVDSDTEHHSVSVATSSSLKTNLCMYIWPFCRTHVLSLSHVLRNSVFTSLIRFAHSRQRPTSPRFRPRRSSPQGSGCRR